MYFLMTGDSIPKVMPSAQKRRLHYKWQRGGTAGKKPCGTIAEEQDHTIDSQGDVHIGATGSEGGGHSEEHVDDEDTDISGTNTDSSCSYHDTGFEEQEYKSNCSMLNNFLRE